MQIVLALFLRPDKSSPIRWLWNMVHKATAFAIAYGLTLPTVFLGILAYSSLLAGPDADEEGKAWIIVAAVLALVMLPVAFGSFIIGSVKQAKAEASESPACQISLQQSHERRGAIGRPAGSGGFPS